MNLSRSACRARTLRLLLRPPSAGIGVLVAILLATPGEPTSGAGATTGEIVVLRHYASLIAGTVLAVLAAHAAIGLALGSLANATLDLWDRALGRSASRARRWLEVAVVVTLVEVWRIAVAVVEHPQLFSHWLYERGGVGRAVQLLLTEHVPSAALEATGWTLLGFFALAPLVALARRAGILGRVSLVLGGLAALGAGTALLERPAPRVERDRPSFLVIGVDSLRIDRLDPRVAPRMSALAARSVRFEQARATVPRTFSGLAGVLTGRTPHHHGIRHMFPGPAARAGVGETLPRVLAARGWETAVVTDDASGPLGIVDFGFQDRRAPEANDMRTVIPAFIARRRVGLLPFSTTSLAKSLAPLLEIDWMDADPDDLATRTIRAIDDHSRRGPFFVLSFFSAAHYPYCAPAPHYRRFTRPDYAGLHRYHLAGDPLGARPPLSDEDREQVRGLYDGAVAATDEAVGRVLDALERRGLAGSTIVVLLADHGENLDELGRGFGHGDHLQGEWSLRVPLVVADPVHRFPAHAVPGIVRDIDLAPTLAALAGARLEDADGVDLGPLLRGEEDDLGLDAYAESDLVFTGSVLPPEEAIPYPPFPGFLALEGDSVVLDPALEELTLAVKHRALRCGRFKLRYTPTRQGARWELFDLLADPDERQDASKRYPEVAARLRDRLVARATEDGSVVEDGLIVPRAGFVWPRPKDSPLAHKMREEARRDAPVDLPPGSPLSRLRELQFLFVGGFLSEAIPGYFEDNIEVVRREVGAEASTLFPPSASDLLEGADLIRREVLERFERSGKPVVLVGHSMGGASSLLAVIRHPDLVLSGEVDRVIAIQGAIGGSPLADSIARAATSALPFRLGGLESLTTHEAKTLFRTEIESLERRLPPRDIARIFEKVFYVRSSQKTSGVALQLLLTHELLAGSGSGENDGLLLVEDMKLDGLGVDLGVVKGDHAALTVAGLLSNSSAAERRAFTRALLREVFERPEPDGLLRSGSASSRRRAGSGSGP